MDDGFHPEEVKNGPFLAETSSERENKTNKGTKKI